MFDLFHFDLPGAVTEQLEKKLRAMTSSPLTEQALRELSAFQAANKLKEGVYQLLLGNEVVYIGKATNAADRLREHWKKLRGRRNLKMQNVRFRCLLLDPNWSTSANEALLIAHYKKQGQCKWNLGGFGPKDVGEHREDTRPSAFDNLYPIDDTWPCKDIEDTETASSLLKKLKAQLPFKFRYELTAKDANKVLKLKGVKRTARVLIAHATQALGYQATLLKSRVVLLPEKRKYKYGVAL